MSNTKQQHQNLIAAFADYLPVAATELNITDNTTNLKKIFNINRDKPVLPKNVSLIEVFEKGLEALNIQLRDPVEDTPVFLKFLENVSKKGYFNNTEEGSDEYNKRYQKVLAKFKSRMASKTMVANKDAIGNFDNAKKKAATSDVQSAEDLAGKTEWADKEKADGNASLKMGDYETACAKYKKALVICPNGPSSHIYHSNLAAALSHLGKHEEAVAACVEAISLKPDYAKAYARLGYARAQMKQYEQAKVAYEKALEYDPSSEATRTALKQVNSKLSKSNSSNSNPPRAPSTGGGGGGSGMPGMPGMPPMGQGGMPNLAGLQQMMQGMGMGGGGGGGLPPGGLAGIMNNPQFMQMAQNMMQNPQMMQMAQNMMQDPNAMAQAQQMMQGMGGGGGGGGGMPDLSAMMGGLNQQGGNSGGQSTDNSGPTFDDAEEIN